VNPQADTPRAGDRWDSDRRHAPWRDRLRNLW